MKRIIFEERSDGTLKEITVDWDKMPCSKCERRWTMTCPKADCWNKDGKYGTY